MVVEAGIFSFRFVQLIIYMYITNELKTASIAQTHIYI